MSMRPPVESRNGSSFRAALLGPAHRTGPPPYRPTVIMIERVHALVLCRVVNPEMLSRPAETVSHEPRPSVRRRRWVTSVQMFDDVGTAASAKHER